MAHYVAQIHAYDCLDQVQWIVRVKDFDEPEAAPSGGWITITGSMQGRGAEHPTRWLRELLEDIREAQ